MLRSASTRTFKSAPCVASSSAFRRLYTRAATGRASYGLAAASATVAALWYVATLPTVHNDAPLHIHNELPPPVDVPSKGRLESEDLDLLVWGSNKSHLLDGKLPESVRVPTESEWFKNVALRDLALHEKHAACVDARGDVYEWGDGFFRDTTPPSGVQPQLTLKGKNIKQLQLTRSRTFALSENGRIYVLASSQTDQALPAGSSESSWLSTLWGESQHVDFAEIAPSEKLKRGERFVQISAGTDHLLAVTSDGRTFAHPITLNANAYGQLGFRKCDVPASAGPHVQNAQTRERVALELTPKSIADPYAKSSSGIRPANSASRLSAAVVGKEAADAGVTDASIRWSDKLFEIPALKGVKVDRAVAGARTSFVKTSNGQVLGWGANEYGQMGLGGNVTLDTITVPTEVILWRNAPARTKTTCRDIHAGGDLTMFEVERVDGTSMPSVEILACGNGQYGGLGSGQYSNAQSAPVRAKNVSGLFEFSDATQNLQAIVPDAISVSPTGHVLLTLDTRKQAGPGGGGRDMVAWGANFEYQLGTGKRGSQAVRDMQGRVWGRGVEVEQRAVAGWNNSVVYWRVC
ncbi:RCC1/BLIP-II [Epithele typhae]|uniref:RCC1/BLIP-II n=1 Tax=Epithele typhae TaxID=378194 RepID=UPI002008D6D4|nr:RCC1/BLIP-II [Epithele typhae]KAH9946265.1 RCC1/BLIP-II [Epithele typhae]